MRDDKNDGRLGFHGLSIVLREKMVKGVIPTSASHSSESWVMNAIEGRRVEELEMKPLRKVLEVML